MELRTRAGIALHPVEVELLCSFAEVDAPFPIEIPSFGTSDVERGVLFSGAAAMLRERGLADERGPLDVAEEFVYLLRACTGVIDVVLTRDDRTVGVAVLTAQDEALMVVQDSAEPDGVVRLRPATLDDALGRLERMVPLVDAPVTAPFSLPRRSLEKAFDAILEFMPQDGGTPKALSQNEVDEILRASGVDERVVRRMVTHLQPVVGSGKAGVAMRDDTEDQWRRAGAEFQWIDTPRGRFHLAAGTDDEADWMSVNPLGADDIRAALRALGARARG